MGGGGAHSNTSHSGDDRGTGPAKGQVKGSGPTGTGGRLGEQIGWLCWVENYIEDLVGFRCMTLRARVGTGKYECSFVFT